MTYGDLVARVDFDMTRDSPYSYACHGCNRCCHNKAIRVTPYEILRLARLLGISTTDFIVDHTEAGGTVLRAKPNGDCGFLNDRGCSVHPDRPLACRIYPLARWVTPAGVESFGNLAPHSQTAGVYGTSGVVQDYLDQQGLAPFFAMSDRYGAVYQRMVDLLETMDPGELEKRAARRAEIDELPAGSMVSIWVDIDASIALARAGDGAALSIDEAVNSHLRMIEKWLDDLATT